MFINGRIDNDGLTTFTTCNGWFKKFKIDFGLLEQQESLTRYQDRRLVLDQTLA